jgi:allophanate hydrolase
LDLAFLHRGYRQHSFQPIDVIHSALATISDDPVEGTWIHLRSAEELRSEARALERIPPEKRTRLYGVPFAVKDNIDVAGVPTTVGFSDFAYVPETSALVVERVRAAGALFVGKVNLDQFATGLVGVRSPYGIPPNAFGPRYVTGGSSSGSAAAVARGHVSFSLATDTAGSGRVPAAFNNLVGLKPSRGLLSVRGLVPACPSIDCVSIMALACDDARQVAAATSGYDPRDSSSRPEADRVDLRAPRARSTGSIGIPRSEDLSGDEQTLARFEDASMRLGSMGFRLERVDMTAFFEAGRMLYDGPWVSERLATFERFVRDRHLSVLPVIRSVLALGESYRATDAFRACHRLAELKQTVARIWPCLDAIMVPTAPFHPRIDEVLADPIGVNARLGRYTTFGNLLDLAAVAVPAGFRSDGLPSSVTFLGPWGSDGRLLDIGSAFHASVGGTMGATGWTLPASEALERVGDDRLAVAVVGAHLSGEPLNHELTDRGGRLIRRTRTASCYRLYALPATRPPKPGLVRVAKNDGAPIAIEVWTLPKERVGALLAGVQSPLGIGTIETEDGDRVHGFLCEACAVEGAEDISSFGGWRAYLRARNGASR